MSILLRARRHDRRSNLELPPAESAHGAITNRDSGPWVCEFGLHMTSLAFSRYLLSLTVVLGCRLPYFEDTYRPLTAERYLPFGPLLWPPRPPPLFPFAILHLLYSFLLSTDSHFRKASATSHHQDLHNEIPPPERDERKQAADSCSWVHTSTGTR